ncbi:hypothetical protein CALCODRAFT_76772 [Calocera cornea HHB12733]|uniref:BTB domain-containing protein n=1 Tax=Calocera cornea HHB12733 TaxID=1353952 RepID=A0A165DH81_9BASI|nr:hypothetical protein CALCODRAFT_76772 [Calocera cornea HHB12733]
MPTTPSSHSPSSGPGPSRAMSPSLLDHLHASFLSGRAADVTLRVLGPWRAEYRMHKVVLLQAGFFEMLFEGGYREALGEGTPVELRFEDPNITRAAFELCLSHLYRPTPLPSLPPAYLPSPSHPLTPDFPVPPPPSRVPRLLLSLLATASYLHIPHLVTDAARVLLGSVSPWTVARYLGFAIGLGLGPEVAGAPEEGEEGVKGLGRTFEDSPAPSVPASRAPSIRGTDDETPSPPAHRAEDSDDDLHTSKSTATTTASSTPVPSSPTKHQLLTSYGTPTNLLGQTCVAWLCRWGADVLVYEELCAGASAWCVWGRGGLPASWVRAVLGADEFWVREEVNRWDVARRVVDLRREAEWARLFEEGIYYSHMTFDNLTKISLTLSPHTGKPYTPLRTLQRAHWASSLLRAAVQAANAITLPNGKPGEMGLMRGTEELLSSPAEKEDEQEALFAVPPDDAQRIGDWNPAGVLAAAVAGIPAASKGKTGWDERSWFGVGNKRRTLRDLSSSAALLPLERSLGWTTYEPYRFSVEFYSAAALRLDKRPVIPGAPAPAGSPSKIHSRTVFYAGSLFNVYIQVVKKKKDDKDVRSGPGALGGDKETQLGVYVQRWSMVNPVPPASAPPATPAAQAVTARGAAQHRREDSAASTRSIGAFASTLTPATPGAPPGSIPLHLAATWHAPAAPGRTPTPSPIPFPRAATPRLATSTSTSTSASASALSRSASPPIPGTPTAVHSPGPPTPGGASQSPPSAFPFPPPSTPTTSSTPGSAPASYPPAAPQTPYRDPRQTLRAYFAVTCCSSLGAVLTRFSSAPDKFDVGQSWGWKSSCLKEGAGEEGGDGGLRVTVVIGLV